MDKETLRMQMLAGIITEGEYKKARQTQDAIRILNKIHQYGDKMTQKQADDLVAIAFTDLKSDVDDFFEAYGSTMPDIIVQAYEDEKDRDDFHRSYADRDYYFNKG
jgi:hypothetical protein